MPRPAITRRTARPARLLLAVLVVGAAVSLALTDSGHRPEYLRAVPAAQVHPIQTMPTPKPVPDGCADGRPTAACATSTGAVIGDGFPPTSATGAAPTRSPAPCQGPGCPPTPTPAAPPAAGVGTPSDAAPADLPCGFADLDGCVTNAINGFFSGVVTAALNPMLDLLSNTLLTTPSPQDLPRLGELWADSWQILLASYGLLVLVAAIVVMSFETLQTRYTIKEIGPRLVVGFLAGALSLWAATRAVEIANGISTAVMGEDLDAASAGAALRDMTLNSISSGIVPVLIGLFVVVMIVGLLVGYVIRVTLTVILIAGAPIALMFHALPQTEAIAYWWWKALGGCLAVQIVQSLALITAIRVFLAPGGFTPFAPTPSGLVNVIVAAALMYVLFKIPFWVLGSVRVGGGGRSLVGSLLRGFIAYKTFGLISGRGGRRGGGTGRPARGGVGASARRGEGAAGTDPYARVRTNADGQYLLPLSGLRRARPTPARRTTPTPGTSTPSATAPPRAGQGRQLVLPLGDDWPENRPVLGRDGQYRLPIPAERRPRRTRPASGPTPVPAPPRPGRRRGGVQPELPFDPYSGNRPDRSGQYPLPLDGVHRVRRPATPPPAPEPPRPRTGRQLRLPLDLPRPATPPPPAPPPRRRPPERRPAPPPPAAPGPPAPRRTAEPPPPAGRPRRRPRPGDSP